MKLNPESILFSVGKLEAAMPFVQLVSISWDRESTGVGILLALQSCSTRIRTWGMICWKQVKLIEPMALKNTHIVITGRCLTQGLDDTGHIGILSLREPNGRHLWVRFLQKRLDNDHKQNHKETYSEVRVDINLPSILVDKTTSELIYSGSHELEAVVCLWKDSLEFCNVLLQGI